MPPPRKGARRGAAAALAAESGRFSDVLAARPQAQTGEPEISWATPRPDEVGTTHRRARRGAATLKAVAARPAEQDELDRCFDRETVESIYDALDLVVPTLHQNDQSIYMHLFRRTIAAGQTKCVIALSELGRLAGVGVSGATYSVRRLESNTPQLIQRTGKKFGKGREQGVEIEVYWPVK